MESAILYEVIIGEELFQIEDVPALVCRECGEEWVEAEVRANIETMIQENAIQENAGGSPHTH
jgi:YgiT-type zinc finger domain-containing protein